MKVLEQLRMEEAVKYKGGLYHLTQIKFAFNSNHIEGSRLTEEQTRYLYETKTILADGEAVRADDIVEAQNHFALFRYMLKTADKPLSEDMIKTYHRILKAATTDAQQDWFAVGEYKRLENIVGGIETTPPERVAGEMQRLLASYLTKQKIVFSDLIDFHYRFECIHPFQDGNGRVGRMILFKEALKNNIMPFIIEDAKKAFYYRGLQMYREEPGYLMDTCLDAQDQYCAWYEKLKFPNR